MEQELNDTLFACDSVTGNASGSYTFNTWTAEEYLCHNWYLLSEALTELGCDMSYIERGAEVCDVAIRCYLLGQAISEVLDEVETEEEEWERFLHKLKHGIGQLKIARLPPHILQRFLAVICVLKVIMIIEFGKIKSKQ